MATPADDNRVGWVKLASSADRASFEAFYRAHHASIGRALAVTLRNDHLASEALDEAMIRAYQRWDSVHTLSSPTGWVYVVGLNWGRSVLRKSWRSHGVAADQAAAAPEGLFDPDVHRALRKLSTSQRAVVVCRYLIGYSEAETAHVLGIRPGTAKSRLHRALAELRATLDNPETPRQPSAQQQEKTP
jgi:RNA polymerase sigma factor (sigma-70 family)